MINTTRLNFTLYGKKLLKWSNYKLLKNILKKSIEKQSFSVATTCLDRVDWQGNSLFILFKIYLKQEL